MTESQGGSVRLICSLSLASCRLKAEALARLLHNKLWSSGVSSPSGIGNSNGDCDRLIKENIFKTKSFQIIDQPPKSQIYGANDVNDHWKHAMHADEEEELFDTPDCSSPPSPAEEDILVNPSVYVSLPGVCPVSSERLLAQDRDPCSSRSLAREKSQRPSTGCKLGGITLKDKEILYEKLQKYANENCSSVDESLETFYDFDNDGEDHLSHLAVNDDINVKTWEEKCAASQSEQPDENSVSLEANTCHQTTTQVAQEQKLFRDETCLSRCNKDSLSAVDINEEQINHTGKSAPIPQNDNLEEIDTINSKLLDTDPQTFEKKMGVFDLQGEICNSVEVVSSDNDDNMDEGNKDFYLTTCLIEDSNPSVSLWSEPETIQNRDLLKVIEEDDRPVLLRSTSLKTGKTPPGTPRRKKIVRFADALGLDLAAVRHIVMDDLPIVPPSAFMDLSIPENEKNITGLGTSDATSDWTSAPNNSQEPNNSSCQNRHTLVPLFQQPVLDPNFLNKVQTQKICVENVLVSDLMVHCVVRVLNVAYEKSVIGRYTINEWVSFDETVASYVPGSCDGFSDKFSFNLFLPTMNDGQKLAFAVRYVACNEEYWDNNNGENYSLCYHSSASMLPSHESRPSWLHHFI